MAEQHADLERLTKGQAAIVGAFTGIAIGPFGDIQEYAERLLGRPLWTHEFASKELWAEIKEACRDDFLAIAHIDGSQIPPGPVGEAVPTGSPPASEGQYADDYLGRDLAAFERTDGSMDS